LTPLRGPTGVIGEHTLDLYRVEYVEVRQPSDAFGSKGLYPDPLVEVDGSIDLPAERNTVLWVTVRVPPGTPAGQYAGSLQVEPAEREAFELPIRLRVLDFTLTDETHTRTAYGVRPHWDVLGLETVDQRREVYRKYVRAMWRHRLSPYDPFMFDGIRWSIDGPRWRLRTGDMELVCDTFSDTYFSISLDGESLGRLSNTVTQFEREGVGYQGTGVGWPGINTLKDVRVLESGPDRWVLEVTGARIGGGAANRSYEITFRFAIAAGRPAVAARMVGFKNTSDVRYQLRGYFYILEPTAEDAQAIESQRCAGWISRDGRMIAGLTTAERLDGNPPRSFYSRREVWLEPGEETEGFGPTRVFFAGEAESEEEMLSVASQLREALAAEEPASLQPLEGARLEADVREHIQIRHDFFEFDAAAEKYLDEWEFTSFRLPCMPGHLAGHQRFTPEYRQVHRRVFRPIIEHLRERGWLGKAYAYWFDEPKEDDYPYVVEGMQVLAESCPGLKRLLTEQVEEPLVGHVDLWVPLLSRFDPEVARQRQQAGDEMWWYVCCGPRAPYPNNFIDHPAINHRIRFWMMDKYNVEGSLYWQTTSWRRNPWENVAAVDPSGERFHGNGDGFFMYPACREPSDEPVLDGPVITLRLEILRDGLEDLEYIWTLKQLVARGEQRLGRLQGEQRQRLAGLLSQARAALAAPDRLAESPTNYSKDPRDLLRERARIAEAITDLRQVLPNE
ncbi:MAG: glycoside hydrolase domain-containing protein, partial [Armatimonadota bacterium]